MIRPASSNSRGFRQPEDRGRAFTLIELLVVVAIIAILAAIAVPVVTKMRTTAKIAETQAFIQQLSAAIEAYNSDFRAYPGPASNLEVYGDTVQSFPSGFTTFGFTTLPAVAGVYDLNATHLPDVRSKLTMSENLVLGLLGGLTVDPSISTNLIYDPNLIGQGPTSLNTVGARVKKKAYIEAKNLSWRVDAASNKQTGHFKDNVGEAKDSIIPEFVDTFLDPMPILYMRAKRGASASGPLTAMNNTIVTYDSAAPGNRLGQYDLHQIIGYTLDTNIGEGRTVPVAAGWPDPPPTHGLITADPMASVSSVPPSGLTYKYPFDAYPYLRNPKLSTPPESSSGYAAGPRNDVPHQKDAFILISAGADRIYGTLDDITNFGQIGQ